MKLIIAKILTTVFLIAKVKGLDLSRYRSLDQEKQQEKQPIPILKYTSERDEKGWKYSYESGNGIQAEEAGFVKNFGDEKLESVVQQGSVTYHDEHGHPIKLTYIADEHGFRAEGDHLPTPPPIPVEIQKSLIEEHQQKESELLQENEDDYEEKAGYGQETQAHGQAQSYVKTQSDGLKHFYAPSKHQEELNSYLNPQPQSYLKPNEQPSHGQVSYRQTSYVQPANKYPHSNGIRKRQQKY